MSKPAATLWATDKSLAVKLGYNPYCRTIKAKQAGMVNVEGCDCIDFASNDYLGLACDKRVKQAMVEALDCYGASMCGTPVAVGGCHPLRELESRFASFIGLEETVVFPTGYQANLSIFSALADPDDLVLIDHYAHASLIQGAQCSRAVMKPFLHNNMAHLEKMLLKSSAHPRRFVVTESVFSTSGTLAPLDEIIELCRRYDAIPVIDDSHGIGVIGENGRGGLEEFEIKDFTGIYTASLGKALGGQGGAVSASHDIIDYLRYSCPGLIYSTGLTPAAAAGVLAGLEIVEREFWSLAKRLWENKALVCSALLVSGFSVADGQAPIISLPCGSAEQTIRMAKQLHLASIFTTPFIPPSVPTGKGCVRMIAGAGVDDESMARALQAFANLTEC
ncbi:MAG: pyridoxal phosphate-dependent aminotransferase family protein [Desulfobulbaceae bacterium]|nr:pyridoxal phosphate-dependent aminotransferase family protein [Desulfobulbaceae bacterium]